MTLYITPLPVSSGDQIWIDAKNAPHCNRFTWHINSSDYVVRGEKSETGNHRVVRLHRDILRPKVGQDVDHKDGNKLNNLEFNLRFCTPAQNSRNRVKPRGHWSSTFKGVCWHHQSQAWRAYIVFNRKQKHLGRFASEEAAARAYDAAAKELYGEFARTNFPGRT